MNPRLIPSPRLARRTILRSQSDERLAYLASRGSDVAFEAIVHRYRRSLTGHCVQVLGSSADADEAVQDALVSAHRALAGGKEVRTLKPWLHAVAHNAAVRILRRRVARAESPQLDCECGPSVDPPDMIRAELHEVLRAVKALPPRQRDAIVMRELEGRSYAEIAARLETSAGAVRQLLNRARNSVRESVGALTGAEPLVRWLMSADEGSPARAAVALSGGSALSGGGAIAIKLSGGAVVSALSVVALMPVTIAPVRRETAAEGLVGRHEVVKVEPLARPVSGAAQVATAATLRAPVYRSNAGPTSRGTFVSMRSASDSPTSSANGGTGRPSDAGSTTATHHTSAGASNCSPTSGSTKTGKRQPASSSVQSSVTGASASPGPGSRPMFEARRLSPGQPQSMQSDPAQPQSMQSDPAQPQSQTPSNGGYGP